MDGIALALHLPADATLERVKEHLQAVKAEADRATEPPWEHRIDHSWSKPDRLIATPDGKNCVVIIRDEDITVRWKEGRDEDNYDFIAHSRQNVPDLASALLIALEDEVRLRWAFGDPENGASRNQIEHLLMHCATLEEARTAIDAAREGR